MKAPDLHVFWMNHAIDLARKGVGLTRPNPPVGAVIVKRGQVVGQGWHKAAGLPHAEAMALGQAGVKAKNATLYVTLEPCCTYGRTPPCTNAILQSGVRQVIVGARDPNPRHAGRGLRQLRNQGVKVVDGICQTQTQELIKPFAHWIKTGRPFLTLKLGMSLDGKIADFNHASRWITGREARNEVQILRRSVDGILVGADTVIVDNPGLLPKPAKKRQPFRIVVDAQGRVPPEISLLNDGAQAQTIMATTKLCPKKNMSAWQAKGATVWVLPGSSRVSLPELLERAGRQGLLHLLCEGGSELAASLIQASLVNEFKFYLAPRFLGGKKSINAIGGQGWSLTHTPWLTILGCQPVGRDLAITAKPC